MRGLKLLMGLGLLLAFLPAEAARAQTPLPGFPLLHLPVEFVNVGSGKCLDVAGGSRANSANVQQFKCNAGKNQTWFIVHLYPFNYQIRTGHVGGKNLDIANASLENNANVQIYDSVFDNQVFHFVASPDGSYRVVSTRSGKCLDVAGASTADGANVRQSTCTGAANQRWILRPRARPLHLIAKHSRKCLDVAGASTLNNSVVQQFRCVGQDNERWYIQYGVRASGVQYYTIVNNYSRKCLDVLGASVADNANVVQFQCHGGGSQQWSVMARADGYVLFRNKHSGKCVGVAGSSTSDNAKVQQFTCGAGTNQRWWWGNYAQRHVQIVQVATSAGADRVTSSDAVIQQHVGRTRALYRPYGTELVYDPAVDKSNINSDALHRLGGSGTFDCLGQSRSPDACARLVSTKWPNKVVVYLRPGNGFTSGDTSYIVLGPGRTRRGVRLRRCPEYAVAGA